MGAVPTATSVPATPDAVRFVIRLFPAGASVRPSVAYALSPTMLLALGLSASLLWPPFDPQEGLSIVPLSGVSVGVVF